MLYIAIGINFSQKNLDLIQRIGQNVLKSNIHIIDLLSYQFHKSEHDNIYLIFGDKAKKMLNNITFNYGFYLPEPDKLEIGIDEQLRLKTWEILKNIKELKILNNIEVVTVENLPVLSTNEIKTIEQSLISSGQTEWKAVTKNGEIVVLSLEPIKDKNNIVNLTFAELFTIKSAMELLDLKEINIAKHRNQ
jgi:hypothetical protein